MRSPFLETILDVRELNYFNIHRISGSRNE